MRTCNYNLKSVGETEYLMRDTWRNYRKEKIL